MSQTITLTAAITPSTIRLSILRAKTAIYYIEVEYPDGSPYDLTNSVMYFHASNGSFVLEKSTLLGGSPMVVQGIVYTDAAEVAATARLLRSARLARLGPTEVIARACAVRRASGITQAEVAHLMGITRETVARLERRDKPGPLAAHAARTAKSYSDVVLSHGTVVRAIKEVKEAQRRRLSTPVQSPVPRGAVGPATNQEPTAEQLGGRLAARMRSAGVDPRQLREGPS